MTAAKSKAEKFLALALLTLTLGGCSSYIPDIFEQQDGGPDRHVDLHSIDNATPRAEPKSRYGNPSSYVVLGKRYYVMNSSAGFTERGIASWYGNKFHGRRTSSGEPYNMYAMTAAHKSLPLPTYVEVTNLQNGRKVIVKVNDRGPFHNNRIIDLSYVAAAKLGITAKGTGLVEIRAIDPSQPKQPILTSNDKPAKPLASSQASATPSIYVQAGAFGNQANATRLQDRLQQHLENPVRISQVTQNNSPLYRVQVGPLRYVELADAVSLKLETMGLANLKIVID
ncbi:MAG: septal ring lytic transglycosylase RlpA family protein [Chromatiales bacterium]|jgi:rare lipoprotein A